MEITPPAIHSPITTASLDALPATMEGARKMPAPITIPTIIAIASVRVSEGRGAAPILRSLILFSVRFVLRADQLAALDALGTPRRLTRCRSITDAHGAGNGFARELPLKFVTLNFLSTFTGQRKLR